MGPGGSLRPEILKNIDYKRLVIDDVSTDGATGEAGCLVFTVEIVVEKAARLPRRTVAMI